MAGFFFRNLMLLVLFLGAQNVAFAKLSDQETKNVSHLLHLVNERFNLQKDVAAYKHNTNMPSFIPGREQQILADVRNTANIHHLDLQTVQNFIDIQMRAAVDVQLKWRSHWKRTDFPKEYPVKDLQTQIRPALSKLTKQIVEEIGKNIELTSDPDNFEDIAQLFSEIIEDPFITEAHREAVLQALVRIKKV